jgi:hypothetical protein
VRTMSPPTSASVERIDQSEATDDPIEFDEEEETSLDADDWWRKIPSHAIAEPMSVSDLLKLGNKILVFLSLLSHSIAVGDKVLLFSQVNHEDD